MYVCISMGMQTQWNILYTNRCEARLQIFKIMLHFLDRSMQKLDGYILYRIQSDNFVLALTCNFFDKRAARKDSEQSRANRRQLILYILAILAFLWL